MVLQFFLWQDWGKITLMFNQCQSFFFFFNNDFLACKEASLEPSNVDNDDIFV